MSSSRHARVSVPEDGIEFWEGRARARSVSWFAVALMGALVLLCWVLDVWARAS